MKLARFPLLAIAIIIVLLQQKIAPVPAARALRSLNDTWQTPNGSLPLASNTTTNLPDPSNCHTPQTFHVRPFFFANSTGQQLHVEAVQSPLASNPSATTRNSTHNPCILNATVSDCGNASSTTEHKSPQPQNQAAAADIESYIVMHVDEDAHDPIVAHLDADAPLYEIASMHVVVKGKDDVTPHPSSAAQVNAPPAHTGAHTEARSSAAKESVHVMEVGRDVFWINAERLGGPTPPPGSPAIHTAAQSSVARESVQVMELNKGDVLWINEEQLAGATPPPSDVTINTAAQSSVARESVQVMVMDVVWVNAEQLGRATPPPNQESIHMAGQKSAARESMQVMEISEDGMAFVNEEQLGASTPPPGGGSGGTIHTASQRSVARESSFDVPLQHEDNQHDHLQSL